jgi:hypothetical protein
MIVLVFTYSWHTCNSSQCSSKTEPDMYQTTKHPMGTASYQPRQLILHTHFNVFHRLSDIPNKLITQFIFFFQKIKVMRLLFCVCACVCACVYPTSTIQQADKFSSYLVGHWELDPRSTSQYFHYK